MITYFGKSDIGKKRSNNQDTFEVAELPAGAFLAVVCDGMGGAHGGKEASTIASSVFISYIKEKMQDADIDGAMSLTGADVSKILSSAASAANDSVYGRARENAALSGMGTTLAAVLFYDGCAYVANVGDSRVYIADKDHIEQVTHDHSYVQYLVDMGVMTEEEAKNAPNRNIITRAVGIEKDLETDVSTVSIPSDKTGETVVLICSDGLCGPLDETEIHGIITNGDEIERQTEELIAAANDKSGSDNITAVLIRPCE